VFVSHCQFQLRNGGGGELGDCSFLEGNVLLRPYSNFLMSLIIKSMVVRLLEVDSSVVDASEVLLLFLRQTTRQSSTRSRVALEAITKIN
jgi:hypothetical protein